MIRRTHTCLAFGPIARRCPYVMPEQPGEELAFCEQRSASKSAKVIGSNTPVKSTYRGKDVREPCGYHRRSCEGVSCWEGFPCLVRFPRQRAGEHARYVAQCFRFDLVLIGHIDPFGVGRTRFVHGRPLSPEGAIHHGRPVSSKDEVDGSLRATCACLLRGFGNFVVASHSLP